MKVPIPIAIGGVYLFIRRNVPAVMWGGGGIGKSSVVKKIVEVLGYGYHETRPYHIKKALRAGTPDEVFPRKDKHGEQVIWFMDEIVAGRTETEDLQVALYEILLDRKFGEYRLWDGVRIVGASNRVVDDAGVEGFLSPLRTRVGHFEVHADFRVWLGWVFGRDLISDIVSRVHDHVIECEKSDYYGDAVGLFRVDPRIILFLMSDRGRELFYKESKANTYGQPAPRSWHLCSRVIFGVQGRNLVRASIGATVGSFALTVFDSWASETGMYDFRRACDELAGVEVDFGDSVDVFNMEWSWKRA